MNLINQNNELNLNGIIMDQINIKRTFDDLRFLEDKFYKIFDLNPCPMTIADFDTQTLIDVNDAFLKEIESQDKNEVIGKRTDKYGIDLISEKDIHFVINEILTKGSIKNYICPFKTINGKIKRGLFSGSIIEFNNKKCIFIICQVLNTSCIYKFIKTLHRF